MTALPWMPLNIADYLADTAHLGPAEHGAYLLLIMHYWQHGGLPDDDRRLARIARMTEEEWAGVRDTIAGFFSADAWGISPADRATMLPRPPRRPGISQAVRQFVYGRDGYQCLYCGDVTGPFELDHVHPWSRGGAHSPDNLAVACRACNRNKGVLTVEEWLS